MNFENCVESKNAVPVCNTTQIPSIKTYTDDLERMLSESLVELTNIIQFVTGETPDLDSKVEVRSLETAALKNYELAAVLRKGICLLGERLGVR